MTEFELRAERRPTDPARRERVPWHLVRYRAPVAMCGQGIEPDTETRPLADIDATATEHRCGACWQWWSVVRLVGEPRGE